MDKKAQKNVLEIFVMSQCPYGVMAENKYIDALKAGKTNKDIKVKLRYIVTDMGDGNFRSLHGSAEWEENVRQLLVQKYYPSLFWKYLEIRNKDYMSSRWDVALKEAGINANNITSKWKEGVELLKKEAAYSRDMGVTGSPSFLWQGNTVLEWGSVSQIPGLEFFNPNTNNQAASAQAASPGQC
ncbi:protein-disulfide isomerase [Elusimicrobium posterum]|uniref:hypothetical protein n=1 Tax=Elusimicrobium posterum TaxID=3116653 RepID=UPI003C78E100